MQDELKLNDEQIEEVQAAVAELSTKFPTNELIQALEDEAKGDKFFADRSAFIEKALTDVLTKDQQARFRELNLQRLESTANPAGRSADTGHRGELPRRGRGDQAHPRAEEEADRRRKAGRRADRRPEEGHRGDARHAGEARGGVRHRVGRPTALPRRRTAAERPRLGPAHQLVLNTLVWDELEADPRPDRKARDGREQVRARHRLRRNAFQPGDPKEAAAPREAFGEAFGKAVDTILTADQRKRLDQLVLQQTIASGLDRALLGPRATELPKALALTDDQKKNLTGISAEFRKPRRPAGRGHTSRRKRTWKFAAPCATSSTRGS